VSGVLELPVPDEAEAAHLARVERQLREEIAAAGGWIGFDRYMDLALYAPGLGYYSAGARKFGPDGDFVTAPEVAPVFGRCVAVQCAEVLERLGGGELLELGAGSGALAAEVLAELECRDCLPERYLVLDVSADLRERQRATLAARVPGLLGRVHWLDRPPERLEGVILANEVLDALPVERFVLRDGAIRALGVALREGRPGWAEAEASPALAAAAGHLRATVGRDWPEGYASELCLRLPGWLATVTAPLVRGVALFVDYGLPQREYYAPERSEGTLLCHLRHRWHDDPFLRPGLQDITAWVDFTAVAEAALATGLEVAGYTTQAHFLIGNGLGGFVADVAGLDLVSRLNLSRQAMLLTLPGEMGERFKAMALSRGLHRPLQGFALRDQRHTL
jgi:SAM-dependent MidA family methyltransferase